MVILPLILNKLALEWDNVSAHLRFPLTGRRLKAAMTARPAQLCIETTNICTADCVFCWYQYQQRPTGIMAPALYRKALEEFAALGGGSLDLTPLAGDPLVDPEIVERIRMARRLPAIGEIRLFTNMILADRHGAANLVGSGLTRLTISVPGFDADTYRRVYRSGQYARMFANVQALLEENRRAGAPVDIALGIRSDRPLRELMASRDMQTVVDRLGWDKVEVIYRFKNWGGRLDGRDLLPGMRFKGRRRWHHPRIGPCIQPYVGAIVRWDGTVGACSCAQGDAAALVIGDLSRQSLGEIWHGEALSTLRASFANGTLPQTCRDCNDYTNLTQILRRHFRGARESLMAGRTQAGPSPTSQS